MPRSGVSVPVPEAARARARAGALVQGDSGAAVLEFALLLPFLVTLVFGVLDFGRTWQLKSRVTNSAREGAQVAQYTPSYVTGCVAGVATVRAAALAEDSVLATTATVAVTNVTQNLSYVGCSGNPVAGNQIKVTVSATMTLFSPGAVLVYGKSKSVTGFSQVVMQG